MSPEILERINAAIDASHAVIEVERKNIELLRLIRAGKVDVEPTKLQKTLTNQPLLTVREWLPDTEWLESWLKEAFGTVPAYKDALDNFADYWESVSARKKQSAWRATLKKNPVFRSRIEKLIGPTNTQTASNSVELARNLYRRLKVQGDVHPLHEVEQQPGYRELLRNGGAQIINGEIVLA